MLIGTSKAVRSKYAWIEVYRSLAHGSAKAACQDGSVITRFPAPVVDFAYAFAEMQTKRHIADYSPEGRFYKSAVISDIDRVESVIKTFDTVPAQDRRAFASWLLFRHVTNKSR